MKLIEMRVQGLVIDPIKNRQILWMRGMHHDDVVLPVVIGGVEALSIVSNLTGQKPPRPLMYDLFQAVLDHFDTRVEEVRITEVENEIFRAELVLACGSEKIHLDARLSDAVVLALKHRARIYLEEEILEKIGRDLKRPDEGEFFHIEPVPVTSAPAVFSPEEVSAAIEDMMKKSGVEEPVGADRSPGERRRILEERLKRAVELEHYEEAARLIKEIERIEVAP